MHLMAHKRHSKFFRHIVAAYRDLREQYYGKDPNNVLFVVRIAQGLLHMGKGLMTLSVLYSDRLITVSASMCVYRCTVLACAVWCYLK